MRSRPIAAAAGALGRIGEQCTQSVGDRVRFGRDDEPGFAEQSAFVAKTRWPVRRGLEGDRGSSEAYGLNGGGASLREHQIGRIEGIAHGGTGDEGDVETLRCRFEWFAADGGRDCEEEVGAEVRR